MKARVFSPAAAREADDQIGPTLAEHPFVANQRGMSAFALPVGRNHTQFNASCTRPLASDVIHAPRVALDNHVEVVLCVQAIKLCIDESDVCEIATTADK